MQATTEELTTLLQIQQIDLDLIKEKKRLDELPQRSLILNARKKKQAIELKRDQVVDLRESAESKVSKLEEEDAVVSAKQKHVQEAIDAVRGDYRSVEAHTKELNGFAKRRVTLEENLATLGLEIEKIEGVQLQVENALSDLEKQESSAIASFQQQGGTLQKNIGRMTALREGLISELSAEIKDLYEQTSARLGGVALGRLMEGRCSVCRVVVEDGRLIDLQAQAPLGVCPQCKRLLVV